MWPLEFFGRIEIVLVVRGVHHHDGDGAVQARAEAQGGPLVSVVLRFEPHNSFDPEARRWLFRVSRQAMAVDVEERLHPAD